MDLWKTRASGYRNPVRQTTPPSSGRVVESPGKSPECSPPNPPWAAPCGKDTASPHRFPLPSHDPGNGPPRRIRRAVEPATRRAAELSVRRVVEPPPGKPLNPSSVGRLNPPSRELRNSSPREPLTLVWPKINRCRRQLMDSPAGPGGRGLGGRRPRPLPWSLPPSGWSGSPWSDLCRRRPGRFGSTTRRSARG